MGEEYYKFKLDAIEVFQIMKKMIIRKRKIKINAILINK